MTKPFHYIYKDNKIIFYTSISIVFLMYFSIYYLSLIKVVNFWSFSQAHINYSEGFIKRGLFGTLMLFSEKYLNIQTKSFFSIFFIFLYTINILIFFLLLKKYLSNKLLFIFIAFSPTLLIFPYNDLGGYQRLDILSIISILFHSLVAQYFYEEKINKKFYRKILFYLIFPFLIISILFHEIQIFSLPFHFFVSYGIFKKGFLKVIKKYLIFLIPILSILFIYPETNSIEALSNSLEKYGVWSDAVLFHSKNIGLDHYVHEIKTNVLNVYNLKLHLLMILFATFPFILIFYFLRRSDYIKSEYNKNFSIIFLILIPFLFGLMIGDFGRWVNLMSYAAFGYVIQFPLKEKIDDFKIYNKEIHKYILNIILLTLVSLFILSIRIPHCCNLQKNNINLYGGIINKTVAIINVILKTSNEEVYDLNKRFK